jgi:hypothetical protein
LDGLDSDPKWREQKLYAYGNLTEVTPLLLLQALFYGAPHTILHRLNIQYALDNIPKDSFPVFTDVRREEELEALKDAGWNPLFVYLRRSDVDPGEADYQLEYLAEEYADDFLTLTKGKEDFGYQKLFSIVTAETNLAPRKPTLHVYVSCHPVSSVVLPNYEPMLTLLDKCRESLSLAFSLPSEVVDKRTVDLFQQLISEADLSEVELSPIENDCWMSFNKSYEPLLPRLREMANLKFYVPSVSGFSISLANLLTNCEFQEARFI